MNGAALKHKKKIGIIGMTGLPARYGGWDKLVEHITDDLDSDYNFQLYCSSVLYHTKKKIIKMLN